MTTTKREEWTALFPTVELRAGRMRTVKVAQHQLVVGRSEAQGLFALDNRCPHEGYPLAQGELKGCELTCCWHNWKFQVGDGRCLLGGEDVRAYAVRERDGIVEVDLADPDPQELLPVLRASLEAGMGRHDNGWALRAAARMLAAGYSAAKLAEDVAAWDGRVAEYGTTHTLAVAADGTRLLKRRPGTEGLYALAPAIDLAGESNRRLPEHAAVAAIRLPEAEAGIALRRAVEEEDGARAQGLLTGAFEGGVAPERIKDWLLACISDHFLDFGHCLIYLVKAQELFARTGGRRAQEILSGLLRKIVLGTREDTLPYMAPFREQMLAVEERLPAVYSGATGHAPLDTVALQEAVLNGRPAEAFEAVWQPLVAGASRVAVARALVGAGARRLLWFDDRIDRDPTLVEGWLWVTHRFTFASAVRNTLERFQAPDALRFLVQAAAFLNTAKALDLPPGERPDISPLAGEVEHVLAAIASREPWRSIGLARHILEAGKGNLLRVQIEDLCLSDPLVRPIVVAHALKTTLAAFEEHTALGGNEDGVLAVLAAVRFLASPIVERRVQEVARRSLEWVVNGRMPKKLTQ